jgi:hypothetical protein
MVPPLDPPARTSSIQPLFVLVLVVVIGAILLGVLVRAMLMLFVFAALGAVLLVFSVVRRARGNPSGARG